MLLLIVTIKVIDDFRIGNEVIHYNIIDNRVDHDN